MNTQSTKYLAWVIVLSLIILTACTSPSPKTGRSEPKVTASFPAIRLESAVYQAYSIPSRVLAEAQAAMEFSVRMVFAASRANGRVPTTAGTYRLDVDGNGTYTPSPHDKLIVSVSSGYPVEQAIFEFNGDYQGDADQFLAGYYTVSLLVSGRGKHETMIYASELGNKASFDVTGALEIDGMKVEGYLSRQETRSLSNAEVGGWLEQEITLQGIIDAEGITVQVDEKLNVKTVAGGMESLRIINSRWNIGDDQYQFQDVKIMTRFRNGEPVEQANTWSASGQLLRNGLPYGEMRLVANHSQVMIVLAAPEESLTLAAWDIQ